MPPTRYARLFPPSPLLDHCVRLLSTVSGTDKVLMVAQYAARLAAHRLRGARAAPALAASLSNLAAPLEDVRYVLRYYALLPMVQYSSYMEHNPPSNPRLLALGRLQNLCMYFYYPLEHVYWLGKHGVIPISKETQDRASLLSVRLWMTYVILYFLHLAEEYRVLGLRQTQLALKSTESLDGSDMERSMARLRNDRQAWGLNFLMNLAYFPLTLHWSLPDRKLLDEGQVAFFGTAAGLLQLQKAWRGTA
ncbi:peroxisomal biogenesis factor 11 [Hyaloraphidium curvatum]|nr:peroxisomal biogenesis factor 11 [Hyaloraphidium curvatum]